MKQRTRIILILEFSSVAVKRGTIKRNYTALFNL